MVWTFGWALHADVPVVGNFRVLFTDPAALRSAWHSVLWVGIALVLIAAGYCIAVLSRQVGKLWRILLYVLILPFGVSAVVSGAVFRLIFDPNPERGMASALFGGGVTWLGPGPDLVGARVRVRLVLAGFHRRAVPRRARHRRGGRDVPARATGRCRRPGPVTAIVVLTVLVAAIRVFDLVLIATPGSIQDDVDVMGLQWWRMTTRSPDTGGPAALAVLLFGVVAVLSVAGMRAMRGTNEAESVVVSVKDSKPARWWSWPLVGFIGLMWTMPVLLLVLTAFHSPESAGAVGWWHFEPFRLDSFVAVSETSLSRWRGWSTSGRRPAHGWWSSVSPCSAISLTTARSRSARCPLRTCGSCGGRSGRPGGLGCTGASWATRSRTRT